MAGDGVRSLRALAAAHPRAGRLPHVHLKRLERDPAVDLERVLKPGERFRLVFTGNHSKGSVFRDAEELIPPALEAAIDATLTALPEFHHGRVDLRFRDPPSLSRGEAWRIIEINGIGSEPIGMWDAFRIGVSVRARGHKPPRLHDVIKAWRRQERMIAA